MPSLTFRVCQDRMRFSHRPRVLSFEDGISLSDDGAVGEEGAFGVGDEFASEVEGTGGVKLNRWNASLA